MQGRSRGTRTIDIRLHRSVNPAVVCSNPETDPGFSPQIERRLADDIGAGRQGCGGRRQVEHTSFRLVLAIVQGYVIDDLAESLYVSGAAGAPSYNRKTEPRLATRFA